MANRQIFFDKIVHHPAWKESMSGKNEDRVINSLLNMGYSLGKDFVRQHPIGERFVIDIAFLNEKIAIEIDGKNHLLKKQKTLDDKRDRYLKNNGWVPIRIFDEDYFGYKGSFYKNLIKEIVEERRVQYQNGDVRPMDIPNFKDNDYE